jgi:hypothetical protein
MRVVIAVEQNLEKLMLAQLVKKFIAFYGTHKQYCCYR